ncbi:MAG: sigma 54-interacting transcriptional regulator, partial [Pseudomonadota bacterium]|nr:sigma 54-interacting transcriptional regulator [Pseudomonadota bacterium]
MSNSDKILTDGTELPEDVLVSRLAVDVDVLVTDCINRIEALKMQLMRMPGPEADRAHQVADLDILRATCLYLGEKARGMPEIQELPEDHVIGETAQPRMEIPSIVGRNAIITKNLNTISKIAPTRLSMLLEGETGSGKELFAKLIHLNSGRNKLVTVNCGAFPPGVIESELFGHVRGAFTGAFADRKGKFEEADGGTIFLDEIGDLELQ